ncbi:malonate decarboxylase holo-[acyl-carrier-protein] synthase [Ferribacterium limneticum]|uniref:malonate decarboxylase holo-[acyl-carrier-protein] synthase n=1 Tax=Ferribacterium limneticum TaxID=76259 RepID=UPI001CF8E4D4|nr:malonate decarboxylase holo-[acyl-carrier-protein] synthase [Ferribacterium limneticum]UCV22783.1 malonate decarboxylase holo-[acyl-carrier-protein] synthase [Ferribacterium limneticum]
MRRHDLVYLDRDAAFETPCAATGDSWWQAARDWIAAGRPLVAARQPGGGGPLLLGLSLPLKQQRKRLTIHVDRQAVAGIDAPLAIARCCSRLPAAEADVLCRLAERAAACSARLGVFGSLAWETLSGEDYRHADSDIDLICDVATLEQLDTMLAALQLAAGELRCRLDGELRFPDGDAVAWREFAAHRENPTAQVLVKGPHEVGLRPVQSLLVSLDEACCHA